jgi:hypothetical protein
MVLNFSPGLEGIREARVNSLESLLLIVIVSPVVPHLVGQVATEHTAYFLHPGLLPTVKKASGSEVVKVATLREL